MLYASRLPHINLSAPKSPFIYIKSQSQSFTAETMMATTTLTSAIFAPTDICVIFGESRQGKPPLTLSVGALSDLFTGISQLGGPPVVAYWLGGKNKTADTRANIILFIAGSILISLVTNFFGGLFGQQSVIWAVFSGPAYGVGLFVGACLFDLASEATFRRVCFVLIALAVITSLPVWR